jgi:hypothetical protein
MKDKIRYSGNYTKPCFTKEYFSFVPRSDIKTRKYETNTNRPWLKSIWGQFHQHSTRSFYVRKLHAQLFCAYILGLYFTGARLLAQKLRVEHW